MKYDRKARVYATMRGGVVRELKPTSGQKSYWGKAYYVYVPAGKLEEWPRGVYALFSYDTKIMEIAEDGNEIKVYWFGYSATTMKHINDFMYMVCGVRDFAGKQWWTKLWEKQRR